MFRERNHREFKKALDQNDARRRREEVAIELRKKTRDEQVQKRRLRPDPAVANNENNLNTSNLPNQTQPQNFGLKALDTTCALTSKKLTYDEVQQMLREIHLLVKGVNSAEINENYKAVVDFRRMLSIEKNPPIQQVIDSGVVPRLVQFLTYINYQELQFEAAWTLTNIASGSSAHTMCVVNNKAVPMFVALLGSPNADVREQAVWALGNIAGDSAGLRDAVLQAGILPPLIRLIMHKETKTSLLRNATWTMSNLCRGKPQVRLEQIAPVIPIIAQLLNHPDHEIQTDACWAFSYISDDQTEGNTKIQAILQQNIAPRLVHLLSNGHANVHVPALRTIGNIVTGDDKQTQAILDCNALPVLLGTLSRQKKSLRKEACWAISNITAGTQGQIQMVLAGNLIPPLIALVREAEFDIQKEAAWAISNVTSGGTEDQIRYIVSQGALSALCALLELDESKLLLVALEGIENILNLGKKDAAKHGGDNKFADLLEECGGLDQLEALQRHENENVYDKALKILQTFFESDEDDSTKPGVQGSQFTFALSQFNQAPIVL